MQHKKSCEIKNLRLGTIFHQRKTDFPHFILTLFHTFVNGIPCSGTKYKKQTFYKLTK